MSGWLIRNARVVNEGRVFDADVLLRDGLIERVAPEGLGDARDVREIDAGERLLMPGVIDDQVHFREPGLTHKEDIAHGSAAAVAGGITSFMEMPNTLPPALTQDLLEDKYVRAAATSVANYSFHMGVSNTNVDEVLRTDPRTVCGLKAFLGSSTGDLLVDDERALERLFREAHMIISVHAEHEPTIRENLAAAIRKWGEDVPVSEHPNIRTAEGCYRSSSWAVAKAREHGTRLHVLHISTARELELFDPGPVDGKRITAEACVHHLWFTDEDYTTRGSLIKWNPAIKQRADRDAIRAAVNEGRIDVVATDHAPHTLDEKAQPYARCPSGGPLVQHSLVAMIELVHQGIFPIELVVERLCHSPARLFQVGGRGYIREGHAADLTLVDLDRPWTVTRQNTLYKCGWSPFEGVRFRAQVTHTWVNGELAYADGKVNKDIRGERLTFDR